MIPEQLCVMCGKKTEGFVLNDKNEKDWICFEHYTDSSYWDWAKVRGASVIGGYVRPNGPQVSQDALDEVLPSDYQQTIEAQKEEITLLKEQLKNEMEMCQTHSECACRMAKQIEELQRAIVEHWEVEFADNHDCVFCGMYFVPRFGPPTDYHGNPSTSWKAGVMYRDVWHDPDCLALKCLHALNNKPE